MNPKSIKSKRKKTKSSFVIFKRWFRSQFGARPIPESMDVELRRMIEDGRWARRMLRSSKIYDEEKDAALYAWQARNLTGKELAERIAPINGPKNSLEASDSKELKKLQGHKNES